VGIVKVPNSNDHGKESRRVLDLLRPFENFLLTINIEGLEKKPGCRDVFSPIRIRRGVAGANREHREPFPAARPRRKACGRAPYRSPEPSDRSSFRPPQLAS